MSTWVERNSVGFDPEETPARQKFRLHQNVRPSAEAFAQGLGRDRQGKVYKGAITGFHRDGVRLGSGPSMDTGTGSSRTPVSAKELSHGGPGVGPE